MQTWHEVPILHKVYQSIKKGINHLCDDGINKMYDLYHYASALESPIWRSRLQGIARDTSSTLLLASEFPRLNVYQGASDQGRVLLASEDDNHALFYLLLGKEATITPMGRVALWQLSESVTQWLADNDLVICVVSTTFPWKIPAEYAFDVPVSVDQVLRLDRSFEDLVNEIPQRATRSAVRRILKEGHEYRVSRDVGDLERFYETIYRPTILARHAQSARPLTLRTLKHELSHGYLLLLQHEGQEVAGAFCITQGDEYEGVALGVLNGDTKAYSQNIIASLYVATIQHAMQIGMKYLHLGVSQAFDTDSLYASKRHWGAEACEHSMCFTKLLVRARELSPEWKEKLNHIGFISKSSAGLTRVYVDSPNINEEIILAGARHAGVVGAKIVAPRTESLLLLRGTHAENNVPDRKATP